MRHTCMSCWHEFDSSVSFDDLGPHTSCPKCGSSFDVDIESEKFCIDIKALYDNGANLAYGEIIPDFEDGEMKYYDLYNEDDELACLDGEECVVCSVCDGVVTFRNSYGGHVVRFKLTFAEANIALHG